MKQLKIFLGLLVAILTTQPMAASDYLTFLTPERGFSEVTSFNDFIAEANYYYLVAPDEDHSLLVGIGSYEAKPSWAGNDTKALRYVAPTSNNCCTRPTTSPSRNPAHTSVCAMWPTPPI